MTARMIRSLGRRLGEGDVEGLALLADIEAEIGKVKYDTITTLRQIDQPYSWAEIAQRLGVSKQAVQQWYARRQPIAPVIPIGRDPE
jgi:hypothetical protein